MGLRLERAGAGTCRHVRVVDSVTGEVLHTLTVDDVMDAIKRDDPRVLVLLKLLRKLLGKTAISDLNVILAGLGDEATEIARGE